MPNIFKSRNFIRILRILTIIFILFLSIFALDSFEGDATLIEKIAGFFIHLIPSFILAAIMIIFRKNPMPVGVSLIITGIAFTFFFKTYEHAASFFVATVPLIVLGILYIIAHAIAAKTKS